MTHKHHVIPKHEWKRRFGSSKGLNNIDNVVYLSIEQHAHVHKLLWENNGSWQDNLAWKCLSGQKNFSEATKEAIRNGNFLRRGEKRSDRTRENMRQGQLGTVKSPETRAKISASRMGQINNPQGGNTNQKHHKGE